MRVTSLIERGSPLEMLATGRRVGHGCGTAMALLATCLLGLATLLPIPGWAAASAYCPTPLTATVARGGAVSIDVSACDGPNDIGMSGPILPLASGGTVTIGLNSFGAQTVTYTHVGSGATSDTILLEDEGLGVVTINITITPETSSIVVTPSALPAMSVGAAFSQDLSSAGGVAPYSYTLDSGALPAGLTLGGDGKISGTPTRRGSYAFSVKSEDSTAAASVKGYAGTVQNPALSIMPAASAVILNTAFSQVLAASGGVAPYTFELESGSLPSGITLSSAGLVSGTTSASAGPYAVTLRVTDSSTGTGTYFEPENYTLTVTEAPSVSISVAPASVNENSGTPIVFTVTRSLNLASSTVVGITSTGTATSGTDYTGGVASVTIPSGATTASISIAPVPDTAVEPNETVTLTVASGSGYTVGTPSSATGTIVNDDVLVTIVLPAPITAANQASYSVSGSCSENDRAVSVSVGSISGSNLCTAGAYSVTGLNVSSLADGSVLITASQTDAAGNTGSATTSVQKSTANVTVANQTLTGTQTIVARGVIVLGPGITLAAGADVTLVAGEEVVIVQPLMVAPGARLRIVIDPTLQQP